MGPGTMPPFQGVPMWRQQLRGHLHLPRGTQENPLGFQKQPARNTGAGTQMLARVPPVEGALASPEYGAIPN